MCRALQPDGSRRGQCEQSKGHRSDVQEARLPIRPRHQRQGSGGRGTVNCDLILMHCDMPELDGYAATLQIREGESHERQIPIVAPAASAVQQDRDKCFADGLDDYPAKPVSRDALRPVLERGYSGVTSPAASEAQPSDDRVAQL